MSGRVFLQHADQSDWVALSTSEWDQVSALAKAYGWPGVPGAPRFSVAEAADLVEALERARVPVPLKEATAKVMPVARAGGINVLHGY